MFSPMVVHIAHRNRITAIGWSFKETYQLSCRIGSIINIAYVITIIYVSVFFFSRLAFFP